jgi:hypothetical protein
MQNVLNLIAQYWQPVLVALLAVDAALIPLFPNATILEKIQSYLNNAKSL